MLEELAERVGRLASGAEYERLRAEVMYDTLTEIIGVKDSDAIKKTVRFSPLINLTLHWKKPWWMRMFLSD